MKQLKIGFLNREACMCRGQKSRNVFSTNSNTDLFARCQTLLLLMHTLFIMQLYSEARKISFRKKKSKEFSQKVERSSDAAHQKAEEKPRTFLAEDRNKRVNRSRKRNQDTLLQLLRHNIKRRLSLMLLLRRTIKSIFLK